MRQETLDRLLLAKSYLDRTRTQQMNSATAYSVAEHILSAHDAAELGIAAICHELDCLPNKKEFISYFDELARTTGSAVKYRGYMLTLNGVRVNLKHFGTRPDPKQWANVTQTTYDYISDWCTEYLQLTFEDLDQSVLITDLDTRNLFRKAKEDIQQGAHKQALERISEALRLSFNKCLALSGFEAGKADAEQALRIASFGVPANEFLSLQHFLPYRETVSGNPPRWKQSQYGHAGNWTVENAEFCFRTAVDTVVKIQDADWVPGPFPRNLLYDMQIEALTDGVEIYRQEVKRKPGEPGFGGLFGVGAETERVVVRVLAKGEKVRLFHVSLVEIEPVRSPGPLGNLAAALAGKQKSTEEVSIAGVGLFGQVMLSQVKVSCVAKDEPWIQQYYSWLPVLEWEPE